MIGCLNYMVIASPVFFFLVVVVVVVVFHFFEIALHSDRGTDSLLGLSDCLFQMC